MVRSVGASEAFLWKKRWNDRMALPWVRRCLLSPLFVPAVVLIGFFVLNLGIDGPAYLSDEIGYLTKASTVAGSTVHMSTSWYGGYSILISPAFVISSDPFVEWHIVLALNAIMWAGSAWLLQYVLRKTTPKASTVAIRLATLGAMAYPSWLSMSGYAFATSGFVLVFMAALASLLKSNLREARWLLLAGALAGYLCWIHPLGFIFLALLVAILILKAVQKRQLRYGVVASVGAAMGLLYVTAIQTWFTQAMSGSTVVDSHYATAVPKILHATTTLHYWLQSGVLLISLSFSVLVATFGLVAYAAIPIVRAVVNRTFRFRTWLDDTPLVVKTLCLLTVTGVICATAFTSGAGQLRIDQWIYGRYTDMYLLPLIGLALLSTWRVKQAAILAVLMLASGVLLSGFTNTSNTNFIFDNKVNIQSFWPMHLASIVHANFYWLWGVLGAIGIVIVGLWGYGRRKRWLAVLALPIALCAVGNYLYHRTILPYAQASSLYTDIKNTYPLSTCIGFTTASDPTNRYDLYSYYLHGYDFKKISWQQWSEEGCLGPYLTYKTNWPSGAKVKVVAQEVRGGLKVVVRSNDSLAARAFTNPNLE